MSVARADAVAKPSLTLKRRLNAPAEKVYAAWTDPQKIVKWFGPDAGPVKSAVLDVRTGGRYAIVFSTEDGEEHHVSGVYREVIPEEKLNFTWAWRTMPERESVVTIALKAVDGGTELDFRHEQLFDEKVRDDHKRGWTGSLDKLEAVLAA